MKREFRIINTFDEFGEKSSTHDYDMVMEDTDDGTSFTLYRSGNSDWSADCRGEVCVKVIDDGDGLIFPKKLSSNKTLDYLEAAELFITLKFINTMDLGLYRGYYEEVLVSNRIEI